jgi:hypothetical protein
MGTKHLFRLTRSRVQARQLSRRPIQQLGSVTQASKFTLTPVVWRRDENH